MDKANVNWDEARYFRRIHDREEQIKQIEEETHSVYGREAYVLTKLDLEWLQAGNLLAQGDNENSIVIKLEKE